MSINIKRFVDIDIKYHIPTAVSGSRDTVVLLTSEGIAGNNRIFTSLAQFTADEIYSKLETTLKYVQTYFNNGGIKLDVRCGITTANEITEEVKKLDNEEIVVCYVGDFDAIKQAATAQTAAEGTTGSITSVYGINQKIFVARTTMTQNLSSINNFAVKYAQFEGAEMTIAAYLSKVNIYGNDSIRDYAFTVETFTSDEESQLSDDDTLLGNVLDYNLNVDMHLSGAIRNLGGNLTNGLDLVNQFTLIVLHQTVTERILNLLVQKLKGNAGIAAIYSVISEELGRYLTNGYLTTDKIWTDETKTIVYNNKTYTIIEQGTALNLGYQIVILPLNSLSDEDKAARKCPPIYIILADQYGIRIVTANGEII